jgi:hypothetical protein
MGNIGEKMGNIWEKMEKHMFDIILTYIIIGNARNTWEHIENIWEHIGK